MNIEKNLAIFWSICVICVTVGTIYLTQLHTERVKHFIDNGYTRTTLVGSDYRTWVKGE